MISIFIFGFILGAMHFFRMQTFSNMYACISIAGNGSTDHINNDWLDNAYAFGSFILIGLTVLAIYDSSFSFSYQYFSSKMSFIVEDPVEGSSTTAFGNVNALALIAGIGIGEGARMVFEKFKTPLLNLYYGNVESAGPKTTRDIVNVAAADICSLIMDISPRTIKMVEVALGTEFGLSPDERLALLSRLEQRQNARGSMSAIVRPINKLYTRNSAGGRAFFERIVRTCMFAGFRDERTSGRLVLAASSLGISQIETLAILLKLGFTPQRTQQQTHSEYQYGHEQYSRDRAYQPQTGSQREQYLALLGLATGASDKKIKSAYRKFAKKYHPDVLQSQNLSPAEMEAASAKMAEINMAYDWLTES